MPVNPLQMESSSPVKAGGASTNGCCTMVIYYIARALVDLYSALMQGICALSLEYGALKC
jgi:hypothetical protein